MRKINRLVSLTIVLLLSISLVACKGSENIQGTWKIQNSSGDYANIVISENTLEIQGDVYEYKQVSVGTKNGVKYYGIELDGDHFSIILPEKKNHNLAIMLIPDSTDNYLSGTMLYAMNKDENPNYAEYAKEYLK